MLTYTYIIGINNHVNGIAEISKKHEQNLKQNICQWQKWKKISVNYTEDIHKKILVCGEYITILIEKKYVKVTKMTKFENSGVKTTIYENHVYQRYVTKKLCKNV